MSEILAMLTAYSPPPDSVRSPSVSSITPCDVAASLSKLDRITFLYALVKYALDYSSWAELQELALEDVKKKNWQIKKRENPKIIQHLAVLALHLSISPTTCPDCNGVKSRNINGMFIPCGSCHGKGTFRFTNIKLQNILNLSRRQINQVWKYRLSELLSEYALRDSNIQMHVLERLFREQV